MRGSAKNVGDIDCWSRYGSAPTPNLAVGEVAVAEYWQRRRLSLVGAIQREARVIARFILLFAGRPAGDHTRPAGALGSPLRGVPTPFLPNKKASLSGKLLGVWGLFSKSPHKNHRNISRAAASTAAASMPQVRRMGSFTLWMPKLSSMASTLQEQALPFGNFRRASPKSIPAPPA